MEMKPSDKFTELLILFEGEVLHGYKDSAGLLTVGIGHLVKPGEPYKLNQPITKEESRRLFAEDTKDTIADVNHLVKVQINQNQFDALCSLVFNIGGRAFAGSSVLRKLNQGDFKSAANHFADWNKARVRAKLTVVKGLTIRRAKEAALFTKPV